MFETEQMETSTTVLLVDDETNITKSLQRTLRGLPYRIMTAENGKAALEILEDHDIDLVISDARMPGMDGVALLSQVQHRWPERMRIMLTGFSDNDTTIKAINDGKIHRYISKPWDDAELCLAIQQTLDRRQFERDRARADLHNSYITTTEAFSSLIKQRLPHNSQTNQDVVAVARAFCKAREFPQKLADDIAMAATLHNLGKLTWSDALLALPVEKMEKDQRERYRDYPQAGESLLMTLEPAKDAAAFIRHHQERWDGEGFPDGLAGLAGHSIPLGARVLKMAVDFVEMQRGMILMRELPREEVLANMPKYAMRLYDPLLCQEFVEVAGKMDDGKEAGDSSIVALNVLSLEPGMTIARNLHAGSGMLLLKEETILTERLIEKLRVFEEHEDTKYVFSVRAADPEKDNG